MLKDDFGISLGPAFIVLGELFWKLYPRLMFAWFINSQLLCQQPGSFVQRASDCFLTLQDALLIGQWFSGAPTVASEVDQALDGAAQGRSPRDLT